MNAHALTGAATSQLWAWFAGLPVIVYLLLAAAVLALLGAAAHLRVSGAAQARSEAERLRREEEREFLLRRDAYLPAAEAIARAQEFLARAPAADLGREGGQAVLDAVMGALGKVHLIGSEPTIKATVAFATELNLAYLNLAAQKTPLIELQNEIDSLDAKVGHLGHERDHLLASITRVAGDGLEQHGAIWGEMNLRFDKLHREITGLIAQRSDKMSELIRRRRQFSVEAGRCSLKLAGLGVQAYLALRQELGVAIDELDYRGMTQRRFVEIEKSLRRLGAAPAAPAEAKTPATVSEPAAPQETRLKMVLKRGPQAAP